MCSSDNKEPPETVTTLWDPRQLTASGHGLEPRSTGNTATGKNELFWRVAAKQGGKLCFSFDLELSPASGRAQPWAEAETVGGEDELSVCAGPQITVPGETTGLNLECTCFQRAFH